MAATYQASEWPSPGWRTPPSVEAAAEIAWSIRVRVLGEPGHCRQTDVAALAAAAGVEIRETDLASVAGGSEALLIPLPRNGFRIAVDPTPRGGWDNRDSSSRRDVRRQRIRFRVAHELGHTLFYQRTPGELPWRNHGRSELEEAFCDRFARGLLIPDGAVRRCRRISGLLRIQHEHDVSLEVAVRALADIQGLYAALFHWPAKGGGPVVQWSNVAARPQLENWRSAVASGARHMPDALALPAAEAALLGRRRQALVIASG
jgi:hypothetical protein